MIKGKRLKRILVFVLLCMALAYLYRWSPYKLEFLGHYDKIWAHRVNSTEKLESAISYFEGVELDLMYLEDADALDVNHPPAVSIGLSFERYLSVLDKDEQPFIWLDIKNLNIDNADVVLNRLLAIFKAKNYPLHRVLVETQQPEALAIFTQKGFKTSFYLPYGLAQMDAAELETNLQYIRSVLKQQPTIGISSDYHDYKIMHSYFPDETKYLWALVPTFHTNFSAVKRPLEDETVAVMLIKYNALKGNR